MLRRVFFVVLLAFLLIPTVAFAADTVPPPQPTLTLPSLQFWALVLGGIVPLVTYGLNHYAPWATEPVKALVLVIASAVVGAVYQLIDTGTFALNNRCLQVVFTAIVGALLAHKTLWLPAGISARLGGGTNHT